MTEPLRWLVLEDGRPGHINQSLGLLQVLSIDPAQVPRYRLPAPRSVLKRPLQFLLGLAGQHPAFLRLIFRCYYGVNPPPPTSAAQLVSTGGDTLLANMILARLWHTPNVFIGRRSKHTDAQVSLLVTTVGSPVPRRVLVIPFAPVLRHGDESSTQPLPGSLAVLIGGDSQEYHYETRDYEQLGQALNTLCADQALRLLLTTSRRTGSAGEQILRSTILPEYLIDATWYGDTPRPTASQYSRQASAILCSEDSGSMLTESLNYAKPVLSFRPDNVSNTPFYNNFLDKLGSYGISRSSIAQLASVDIGSLPPTRQIDYSSLRTALEQLTGKTP